MILVTLVSIIFDQVNYLSRLGSCMETRDESKSTVKRKLLCLVHKQTILLTRFAAGIGVEILTLVIYVSRVRRMMFYLSRGGSFLLLDGVSYTHSIEDP